MIATVECHSGYAYAERPLAFFWQGQRQVVAAVLDQARLPQGRRFIVRAEQGQEFELLYREDTDEWQIQQSQEDGCRKSPTCATWPSAWQA